VLKSTDYKALTSCSIT